MNKQAVCTLTHSMIYNTKMSDKDIKRAFKLLLEEMFQRYDIKEEDIEVFPVEVSVD